MGLGNSGNGKTFVQVVGGMMAIRVSEGTQGAVSRVLAAGKNQGKLVYEQHYQYLDGKITGITYDVKDFGAFINIEIDDKYILSVPWKSSMKRNIVSQLPNVDFSSQVRINAFSDKTDAKRNVLLVKQNGENVKFQHTKDEPNGLPLPVETVELGKKKLDYKKVEEFLYNVLQAQIGRFNEENGIEVEPANDEPSADDF